MVDAGGPWSVRKCPGAALADLDDVEGFDRSGEEYQLYAFQLSDGVYKRKKFTPSKGIRSLKFEELSGVDISHAVPMGCLCRPRPTNWLVHRLKNRVSIRRDWKGA